MSFTDATLIEIDDVDLMTFRASVKDAQDAMDEDSRYEEIDALWAAVNAVARALGVPIDD